MAPHPGQPEDRALVNLAYLIQGKPSRNDDWRKLCLAPAPPKNVGSSPNHYMLTLACCAWVAVVEKKADLLPEALKRLRIVAAHHNDHNQQEGQTDSGHTGLWMIGAITLREALQRLDAIGNADLIEWIGKRIRQVLALQWFAAVDADHPERLCVQAGQRWRGPKGGAWWEEWFFAVGFSLPMAGFGWADKPTQYQEPFTANGMFRALPRALSQFRSDAHAVRDAYKRYGWAGLRSHVTEGTRAEIHTVRLPKGYVQVQTAPQGLAPTRYFVVSNGSGVPVQFPDVITPVQRPRDGKGELDLPNRIVRGYDALSQIESRDGVPMGLKDIRDDFSFAHLGEPVFYMVTSPAGVDVQIGDDDDTLDPFPVVPVDDPLVPAPGPSLNESTRMKLYIIAIVIAAAVLGWYAIAR